MNPDSAGRGLTPRVTLPEPIDWTTETQVVTVALRLTDRQANDLYGDIYRMQRDLPGSRQEFPMVFEVYDTLDKAGVDGTR